MDTNMSTKCIVGVLKLHKALPYFYDVLRRSCIILSDTIKNFCQASKDLNDDANTYMRVCTMMKYQLIMVTIQLQR